MKSKNKVKMKERKKNKKLLTSENKVKKKK